MQSELWWCCTIGTVSVQKSLFRSDDIALAYIKAHPLTLSHPTHKLTTPYSPLTLKAFKHRKRHHHLLQTHATMLKGIFKIIHIVIVIIRICKKTIFFSKYKGAADMLFW